MTTNQKYSAVVVAAIAAVAWMLIVAANEPRDSGLGRCTYWCVEIRGHDAARLTFLGGWGPPQAWGPYGYRRERLPDAYRCECADARWDDDKEKP